MARTRSPLYSSRRGAASFDDADHAQSAPIARLFVLDADRRVRRHADVVHPQAL